MPQEPAEKHSRELLQRQLQEANRKAQEYRQQLLKKEQEAEQYRRRLEAIAHSHTNGTEPGTALPEPGTEGELAREAEEAVAGEEVVVLPEGAIIIKAEDLDAPEEQVTLVETLEATPPHAQVTS